MIGERKHNDRLFVTRGHSAGLVLRREICYLICAMNCIVDHVFSRVKGEISDCQESGENC